MQEIFFMTQAIEESSIKRVGEEYLWTRIHSALPSCLNRVTQSEAQKSAHTYEPISSCFPISYLQLPAQSAHFKLVVPLPLVGLFSSISQLFLLQLLIASPQPSQLQEFSEKGNFVQGQRAGIKQHTEGRQTK